MVLIIFHSWHVRLYFCYQLGAFVDTDWGLSFVAPGVIIIVFGIVMWLFLVPRPEGEICVSRTTS